MADISFYLYLEAAFRHKLFKDRGAAGFKWERYNLPYESTGQAKGIFEYARKVLPSFYSLHYPDTKEGHLEMAADFIKKLDQRQDPQIARYFNPDTAPREHLAVTWEAQAASQQTNARETSAASAAGSAKTPVGFPQAPAFVHNAAQARPPDTRLPIQPAESTPDIKQAKFQIPKTPFPVKNTLRNLGSKAGVFFQKNIGKHLTVSRIATGVSATIGAVAGAGFGPLGALSGAGLGALAPSWVKSGQATRFLGKAGNGAINAWVSASNQINGGAARLTVSSGSKKLALGLVGGLFLITSLGAFIGSPNSPRGEQMPTGITSANTAFGLTYTLPLKEPAVAPLDIKDKIKAAFPGAKLEYWDPIVQKSRDNGWNPALLLALWIEETGASHATLKKNGGSEIPVDGNLSKGHLGCAPEEDQTIEESLTCVFKFGAKYNFSNDQFPEFMAKYSGGSAENPFADNPDFINNFKTWYTQLVPSGSGAIAVIAAPPSSSAYVSGGGSGIFSCPVNNGAVIYGSKEAGGHCSFGYEYECIPPGQPGYTGRETAVDIKGSDSDRRVFLPYLSGNVVDWTINEANTVIDNNEGGGVAVAATASSGGKLYRIRFVHIESTNLEVGQKVESATAVGLHVIPSALKQSFANHVHITISEDDIYKPTDLYFNLCK